MSLAHVIVDVFTDTPLQGNQLAVDHVNAAGGIKSMGGAKLVLVPGDTQAKPEVARAEIREIGFEPPEP